MSSLVAPLRSLQLPYRQSAEESCAAAMAQELNALGVAADDAATWVSHEVDTWIENQKPSTSFSRLVGRVFQEATSHEQEELREHYQRFSAAYFRIHAKIIEEHGLLHAQATAALSHAALAISLAVVDRLSAAQIARVLDSIDKRARFGRQLVGDILSPARALPAVTLLEMARLYEEDAETELAYFGDAPIATAAVAVSEIARQFGFEEPFAEALQTLAPEDRGEGLVSYWTPYLQILHYQCVIAEFYDHAMMDLYEFSPRGNTAKWLFEKYPHAIAGADNPFLNNAKSVEVIDVSWVRAKKRRERSGARAIYNLLSSLDTLGFAGKREVARVIRLWLHRIIRRATEEPFDLPSNFTPQQVRRLIEEAGEGNTRSFGIIEQRLVDAAATLIHPELRSRGVRDSVNATNVSSKKFGDCEFINPRNLEIHAYESHGGSLSDVYIEQHLYSLRKTVEARAGELSAVADPSLWRIVINFVAHDISDASPSEKIVSGVRVEVVPVTFRALLREIVNIDEVRLCGAFEDFVLQPMRESRTPASARRRLMDLTGSA